MSNAIVKVELNKILTALLGSPYYVEQWWSSPNRAFDGQTPNDVYWESDDGRAKVAHYISSQVDCQGS